MTSVPPPRFAERLLRWSLSPSERPAVLGDLQEEFAEIAETDPRAATRWYWRQALTSIEPNVVRAFWHQLFLVRRVVDDTDRRSRLWRRSFGASLMGMGVVLGLLLVHAKHDATRFYDAAPFIAAGILAALTGSYRAMQFTGRSRRYWMAMALYGLSVPFSVSQEVTGHSRVPATVRAAMPMLTARQQRAERDPDDDPLMPTPARASELDVTVSLAGLAVGAYVLRVVAAGPDGTSYQRVDIDVRKHEHV